ncbi:MAG: protease pro-enzyme activation domain-containing protein [Trebonia sp.]|uniref:S53 family peptidase n=1 Tax=Trebonia sp. TaxID=2767075 RepID=UPI003CA7530C
MPDLVALPGSERTQLSGVQSAGQLNESETITVTLVLRRRAQVPAALVIGPETVTHEELDAQYGAETDDIALVTSTMTELGLTVTDTHQGSRRMMVSGTIAALSAAFGTTLTLVTSPQPGGTGEATHRYRSGSLSVPAQLAGIVTAVLGLDDRPVARPQFRRLTAAAASRTVTPETVTPETVTPETVTPETVTPETVTPETVTPETVTPETVTPETVTPETVTPETVTPETVTPETVTPETVTPETVTPETVTPEASPAASTAVPLTAPQVASLYNFPAGTDGTGQTIAIIELGGGYTQSDLDMYFRGLGLATPSVTAVGVDGGSNSPGQPSDGEVELDIQVAGAVAPKAAQLVYFAANTDQGFINAIAQAVHTTPPPIVVSISWGQSEDQWSEQSRNSMDSVFADAAALGVTVTVAAGDNGSSDDPNSTSGVHVDFPASSPHVLACGGTQLIGNLSTNTITSEVVWNELANNEGAGGGGVSDVFPLPSWQANVGVPTIAGGTSTGRGVPDVAGNADPVTGYLVVVDGKQQPIGGTSAVAPLWAGLIARLAQATGKKFGLLQPLIYGGVTAGAAAQGFNDITQGNNGAYSAGPGWDATTGLGSPNGQALLTHLSDPPPQTATVTTEKPRRKHWWSR